MQVGEGGAEDGAIGREVELINTEHIAADEEREQQNDQDSNMRANRAVDADRKVLQAERKCVDAEDGDQDHDEPAEQPRLHEGEQRQRKDIESGIALKGRVCDPEMDAMEKAEHCGPLTGGAAAENHGEKQGGRDQPNRDDPVQRRRLELSDEALLIASRRQPAGKDKIAAITTRKIPAPAKNSQSRVRISVP